jgi:L-rhamnose mutarotase
MRYNSFLHIFPEQCAEYLKKKFRMHSNLTVRELMVILKRIGIKTIKIHNNGKIYDVFSKRDIDGI